MGKNPVFQRARNALDGDWFYALILLIAGLISYSLQLPRMGFYWDDWQGVFLSQIADKNVLWDYFAYDRPFSAWTYALTFPIFGTQAWIWQLSTLLLRWIGLVCLYKAFIQIWPTRTWEFRWVFILAMVYPGFSLQPVSLAFNQHFITFAFFGFSIFAMVRAVRSSRLSWLWTILAVFTSLTHTFTMEYFVGLELIRPILLWYLMRKPGEKIIRTLRKVILWWLPYIAVLGGFAFWRFIYYPTHTTTEFVRNTPSILDTFFTKPISALLQLVQSFISDGFYLLVNAWGYSFQGDTYQFSITTLISFLIGVIAAVLFAAYQRNRSAPANAESRDLFPLKAGILGLGILLFGSIPYWLTGRLITVGKWSNRLSLAPMLGAILCVVLGIDWLFRTQKQKSAFLAALLCISILSQVHNTDSFRRDWDTQRDYYWQLAWRAPKLQSGTAIFAAEYPNRLTADYAFSFAINTLYGGAGPGPEAHYWFFTPTSAGISDASLSSETELTAAVRNIHYQGNLSHAIAVAYHPSAGCLRVLDEAYIADPAIIQMDLMNVHISNPESQILNIPAEDILAPKVIGKEPAHAWCYYFQKADLARQFGRWDEIFSIMSQASNLSLKPKDGAEYLPLMDAYANTGQWREALATSYQASQQTKGLEPFLCRQWQRYQANFGNSAPMEIFDTAFQQYSCK